MEDLVNINKFFLMNLALVASVHYTESINKFKGDEIEVAIRKSDVEAFKKAIGQNHIQFENNKDHYKQLVEEMVNLRRDKYVIEKPGFLDKGRRRIYAGCLGAYLSASMGLAFGYNLKLLISGKLKSRINETRAILTCGGGLIISTAALGKALHMCFSTSRYQQLMSKYNRALEIKSAIDSTESLPNL